MLDICDISNIKLLISTKYLLDKPTLGSVEQILIQGRDKNSRYGGIRLNWIGIFLERESLYYCQCNRGRIVYDDLAPKTV